MFVYINRLNINRIWRIVNHNNNIIFKNFFFYLNEYIVVENETKFYQIKEILMRKQLF